ncbi:MAG TPA: hypothetical protein VFV50_03440 [Bdellovibrionales bacterium]|nr:hypothetical protein [Bdellovibrionales bacterium]
MKLLAFLFAMLALNASTALASGTVCAGPVLHYVDDYHVTGIPPPEGFMYHEEYLTAKGKMLAHVQHFQSQPSVGTFEYGVVKTNEKTLASQGNQSAGWSVYSAVLTVMKGNDPNTKITDLVVCKDTWAIVP